jgi:predicted nucleic-acid-binding protein
MPQRKKDEKAAQVHWIDTNILIRFLIGDDPPKAARAKTLMKRVERAEEFVEISPEVLTETVWTLQSFYKVPRTTIAERLAAILSFAGVRSDSQVSLQALQSYATTNADFVDCLLAARSHLTKIAVYTFDEDFRKLPGSCERP